MNNPGAKLKIEMNNFMGDVIKLAYDMAPDEFAYRRFRKQVLDKGNQLIRDFNEELAASKVGIRVSREELIEEQKRGRQ